MDTRTGEIFDFKNEEEKELPNCTKEICKYYEKIGTKISCRANRKTRRKNKCFVNVKGMK